MGQQRHLMEQIIPMICNAASAFRPGFAVFVCYVMACARQNDSTLTMKNKLAGWVAPMSHIVFPTTSAPLLSNIFVAIWRNAGVHFRADQLFHDFITQTLKRSVQYGIVVMGVIDAVVFAHNYHRHNANNPGSFEDCMEGRIRLLTAITPRYAHAYQSFCRVGRPFDFPHQRFRLPSVKAKYPSPTQHSNHDSKKKKVIT